KDYVRTVMIPAEEAQETVRSTLTDLEKRGQDDLAHEGIPANKVEIDLAVDLRYVGQSYELTIPYNGDIADAVNAFHAAHERRFGYCDFGERVQVVNVRLKARGIADLPVLEQQTALSGVIPEPHMMRDAFFTGADHPAHYKVPVYERHTLQPGGALV